jgi:MFS family permease
MITYRPSPAWPLCLQPYHAQPHQLPNVPCFIPTLKLSFTGFPRHTAVTACSTAIVSAAAAAAAAAAEDDPPPLSQDFTAAKPNDAMFLKTVIPTALALMLCNMDRICLSIAMVAIAAELGWAEGRQGIVQSAFLWGYLANQLLGGTLADRYGGKRVMAYGIAFFSLASAALPLFAITPFTAALGITLPAVLLSRFLVGLGEGVALPSMNNLIATRIQPSRRATALGTVFTGFQSGNLVGLALSPVILHAFGWRGLFYLFGLLGAPLLVMWQAIVPELPSKGREEDVVTSVATDKAATIARSNEEAHVASTSSKDGGRSSTTEGVSLKDLLANSAVWAIIVANFANHWGYFMYLNWMPTYFAKVHAMDLRASSLMSFLPWLVMAIGSSVSGIFSDALVRKGWDRIFVRKAVQTLAFLGPVVPLLALAGGGLNPGQATMAMTAALGLTSVGQFVTNMSEVAPRHAGRLFGLCNTFGSMAGILGVSGKQTMVCID